jgi:chromate transporter
MSRTISRTTPNSSMNDARPAPSLHELALTFNKVSLAAFGGGLSAWSRQVIVEERRWLDDEEFLSAMTICRVLPGANQVNLAVFVGTELRGVPGAIASVLGLTAVPVAIVLVIGWLYFANHTLPETKSILHGMAAASVALSFSMAYKAGLKALRSAVAWGLFGAAFIFSAWFRVPLLALLAVLVPLGLWWAWPRGGRLQPAP